MKGIWGLIIVETVFVVLVTYLMVPILAPVSSFDYLSVLFCFLGVPLYTAIIGFFLGWKAKKSAVVYSRPDWQFETVQMKTDDCVSLVKDYVKRYRRLVPLSRFWYFHLPIVLIVLDLSLPYYSFFTNRAIGSWVQILSVITVLCIDIICIYGAYRATSNSASPDFQLPLIREALWVASVQRTVPNVSSLRIAMEKGRSGDFSVYRNPRAILRISGFENEAYIESSSEELKSVSRVVCVLRGPDGSWGISWLWDSRDRNFVKWTPDDKDGYYVRNPVPSRIRELGVKDVRLVTRNAIALVLLEYVRKDVNSTLAKEELRVLGVE
jgi:hypothetical protein